MKRIGFKEWALACDALGHGRQSILLRKGGVAEGRDGFSFQHREFFLFPTWFHEQLGKVRGKNVAIAERDAATVEITLWAKLELARVINSWQIAEALEPLHILKPEVVRERFEYKGLGLHIAFARIFRVRPTW